MSKEVKRSNASIAKGSPEQINFSPSDGRETSLEVQYQNFQGQPEPGNSSKPIKTTPNTNGTILKGPTPLRSSSFKKSESGRGELQSRDLNVAMHLTKEVGSTEYTEEPRSQTPSVGGISVDENRKLSAGADKEDLMGMFVSRDPQEFVPKNGAYLESAEQLKSVKIFL